MPEYGEPERIEPQGPNDYLEVMSKSVFQSGISWRVVEAKWPTIREAFHDFDARRVAGLSESEIDALASDTRVIRNRRKIEGIVSNAARILELDAQHGGFRNYLRGNGDYEALVKALRKDFKFLGDMGCYHFLWGVGEEVPPYEEWSQRPETPVEAGSDGEVARRASNPVPGRGTRRRSPPSRSLRSASTGRWAERPVSTRSAGRSRSSPERSTRCSWRRTRRRQS